MEEDKRKWYIYKCVPKNDSFIAESAFYVQTCHIICYEGFIFRYYSFFSSQSSALSAKTIILWFLYGTETKRRLAASPQEEISFCIVLARKTHGHFLLIARIDLKRVQRSTFLGHKRIFISFVNGFSIILPSSKIYNN